MKVFVSGQIGEKEYIQIVYKLLEENGFSITHDWTRTDDLEKFEKNSNEAALRAQKDITGVCVADIYIIETSNKERGKGMYVELGAALALAETGKNVEICVVGDLNHDSIFYHHPSCVYFKTIEECVEYLLESKVGTGASF